MASLAPATTKEELEGIAKRLTAAFSDGSARTRLNARVEGKGMMYSPQLLSEIEVIQRDLFAEWGYEPTATLQNLQQSVRKYPETQGSIMLLCDAEETLIETVQQELAKANGIEIPAAPQGGGGHGHGGHGHGGHGHGGHGHGGHGHGGHGHSHGGHGHGGHGHSHGDMNAPPGAIMVQQLSMQLVQRSFAKEQLTFMENLRAKVMAGGMPSGEEQLQAMQVQQTMMKKMANMRPLVEQAMETLGDEERTALYAVEDKLKKGEAPSEEDRKTIETAKDTVATYIATMGPMLMAMRQQQQQGASAAPVAAAAPPAETADADKKKD